MVSVSLQCSSSSLPAEHSQLNNTIKGTLQTARYWLMSSFRANGSSELFLPSRAEGYHRLILDFSEQ